jgi:hypothetical protein
VIAGGVLIVFSTWRLYFFRDAGDALEGLHDRYNHDTYVWGYGHHVMFAWGAAIGAGLAARVDVWRHNCASSHLLTFTPVPELAASVVCAGLLGFELVKQPMNSGPSQRPNH